MEKVHVNAGKGYSVHIGNDILHSTGEILSSIFPKCRVAIITDDIVEKLYLPEVKKSLCDSGFDVCSYAFPNGEKSKNISTLSDILEFLAESRLTRSDLIIALGGGVPGDITGFASAVYLRGIPFVQIPTTLLAAVDSSVGGKTAVNLCAGKNLAGAFNQPRAVICDTKCLNTLSPKIFSDGLAEAIKYGILTDRELFDMFGSEIDSKTMIQIIKRCVSIKAEIVESDEFDNGKRRFLNLGHTVGHAIEKCSSFDISHGSAVAIGTVIIARAGEKLGITAKGTSASLVDMYEKHNLPVSTEFSAEELFSVALSDKKREGDTITVVFPSEIGKSFLNTIQVSELEHIIISGLEAQE